MITAANVAEWGVTLWCFLSLAIVFIVLMMMGE